MSSEKNGTFRHHSGQYRLHETTAGEREEAAGDLAAEEHAEQPALMIAEGVESDQADLRLYMPRHGSTSHRALDQEHVTHSAFHVPGAFGRMFPTLPAVRFTDSSLERLASAMLSIPGGGDNPGSPAGFTFLGQFIDHDITFDPTSSLEKQNDPEAIHNFRTPVLELDSLYGSGPATHPFLYDAEPSQVGKMLLGRASDGRLADLPRNQQGTALVGDPRNDENLIISQLHVAFLKFHNRVLEHILARGAENGTAIPEEFLFEETQRVVRWHYQWIIIHEFLKRILGEETWSTFLRQDPENITASEIPLAKLLETRLESFRWTGEPFIPVEFAVAAYRFGHSQVRPTYAINDSFDAAIFPNLATRASLDANNALRRDRVVDWSKFFDVGGSGPQLSKRIDSAIAIQLRRLPGFTTVPSLPERNLKRGNAFGLPSGQQVAAALGVTALTDDELAIKGVKLTSMGFPQSQAPLWYYVLKEAEVRAEGRHLGPVGGRIVGEVLLGLLRGDAKSYLNQVPFWKPFLPSAVSGDFAMADLIRFGG